ncbi:hypothetical protein PFISCL1PPCAC_22143, partial [Pristionchus fissidentatus]
MNPSYIPVRPLFISPIHPFEFALLIDSKLAVINYKYGKKKNKKHKRSYEMQIQEYTTTGTVAAAHLVHDMKIALVTVDKELLMFSTVITALRVAESLKPPSIDPIATQQLMEAIVQIAVCDRSTSSERAAATLARTIIRLWSVSKSSLIVRSSIDCTINPVSRCALVYRETEREPDDEDEQEEETNKEEAEEGEPPAAAAAGPAASYAVFAAAAKRPAATAARNKSTATAAAASIEDSAKTVKGMVALFKDTLSLHECTERSANSRISKRCPFGDCSRATSLAIHLDQCS